MRRVFILALLLGGMQLLLPLGERGYGGQWLLTFGFLILAADTVGALVIAFRLPRIVGYLVAGVLFGPSVLGTVSSQAIEQLAPVSALAIALIAFLAGAELRWSELREHGIMILKILAVEMSLTLLDTLHARWVRMLRSLRAEAMERAARHPDHGLMTMDYLLQQYAWHGRHHVGHITSLRARENW